MKQQPYALSLPLSILLAIFAAICWSVSPVLSRFIRDYYTVFFQNFFRFSISLVVLWIFTLSRLGRRGIKEGLSNTPRLPLKLSALAVFVFLHQMFYLAGIYRVYPALASLLSESNAVFTILLAYIMFQDERITIRSPRFMAGLFLALAGMTVIILSGSGLGGAEANLGILFVILGALSWSIFTVMTKHWIPSVPPSLSTAVIFSLDAVLFALVILFFEGGTAFPQAPPHIWGILTLSGLFGIGGGYTFYFSAIPGAGVTVASAINLLIPLFTGLFSFIILGELLLPLQAAAGAMLIFGCYLIIRARAASR